MAGLFALVGGDEFSPGCEDMDRAILEATGVKQPTVVVIPTAAADQNPSKAASNGVSYFSSLGADASALMVLEAAEANDEQFLSLVDTADAIYFTGGNPVHLMDTLAGSLLIQRMKEAVGRGLILAGSSAGAMVLGSWMRFRAWREALCIVQGVAAFPHHERSDPESVAKDLAESVPANVTVLGIDGRTCCLGNEEGWKVLGPGKVIMYQGGRWYRFSHGERFELTQLC